MLSETNVWASDPQNASYFTHKTLETIAAGAAKPRETRKDAVRYGCRFFFGKKALIINAR